MCQLAAEEPRKSSTLRNKYKRQKPTPIPHQVITSRAELQEYFKLHNKAMNDIAIYTDGAYIRSGTRDIAGIGIYIEHKNEEWYYEEAIGEQPILYAEQLAICRIKELLKCLEIKIEQKTRTFIMTDSQITFDGIFKETEKAKYPPLMKQMKELISTHNAHFAKIPSHEKNKYNQPDIEGNEKADALAQSGRNRTQQNRVRFADTKTHSRCFHIKRLHQEVSREEYQGWTSQTRLVWDYH